jgi:competence protein ComEC
VFQAGYATASAIAAAEVLERYRERGITIVASPTCGAWLWHGDGPSGGTCQRETGRRSKHHPGLPIDP